MSVRLNLIAAACENMGIGKNGDLPWRLKSEMAYFTSMTTRTQNPSKQNAVIMGRISWECIPLKFRPLSNRLNVVLTKNDDFKVDDDVLIFPTLESAVEKLKSLDSIEKIWIIGGSYVYKSAIDSKYPCRLYLTKILKNFDCDTFFPEIPDTFKEIIDPQVPTIVQEEKGIQFQYKVYEK